jgi:hypothetical protein
MEKILDLGGSCDCGAAIASVLICFMKLVQTNQCNQLSAKNNHRGHIAGPQILQTAEYIAVISE